MKFLGGSGQFDNTRHRSRIAIVGYGIIEYKNSKFRVIIYGAVTTPAGMDILKKIRTCL